MRAANSADVLIIGCGIAGGSAALALADAGVPVTVVTRAPRPEESNTYYAQGGIIYRGQADSPRLLIEDVLRAGSHRNRVGSVRILAKEGPPLVKEVLLEQIGVPFDRNGGSALALAREGGHSLPRIIHAADATGKAIAQALVAALQAHPRVTLLTNYTALDLIIDARPEPDCLGAYLLNRHSGQVRPWLARKTILATGGLGQIYVRTSNPPGARGDGVAIANRAGARIVDMEFVQFHPTTFAHPNSPAFLISEAVRGAGARLVHADGQPFMEKYDPTWKDLAPRDVVARAIHQEMEQRGVPHVYLDLASTVPLDEIRRHFPTIDAHCRRYGIDITHDLVPVAPAAHYSCGGVWVDEWGRTTVRDLYAVGEVACTGLHGANRLASTSLLEGLVWGRRAARHICRYPNGRVQPTLAQVPPYPVFHEPPPNPVFFTGRRRRIKTLMWQYTGLTRTTGGLEYARDELNRLAADIEQVYNRSRPADNLAGLRNLVQVAGLVTAAALANNVGVGCHYRVDGQVVDTQSPKTALGCSTD